MGKFKNIALIGIIILLSIINYVWAENSSMEKDEILQGAFNATGADIVEIKVNGNNIIMDRFLEAKDMQKIGEELAKDLAILKNNENFLENVTFLEEKDTRRLIITGKGNKNETVTILLTSNIYNAQGETALSIDIIDNSAKYLKEITNSIENIFHKFNISAKITTCITGNYNAKLEEDAKISIIEKAIRAAGAHRVEGMIDTSLISIAAYSPNIEEYIYTGNQKMNLNIAMRYNEYEDRTYIWIGTPIISMAY